MFIEYAYCVYLTAWADRTIEITKALLALIWLFSQTDDCFQTYFCSGEKSSVIDLHQMHDSLFDYQKLICAPSRSNAAATIYPSTRMTNFARST
jgi:hypothetical protein